MDAEDYAILVGITNYPLLTPLRAPEADALRFKSWLISDSGGKVPEQNITLLLTSTFDPPEPPSVRKTRPFPSDFEEAVIDLCQKPRRPPLGRIGRRLYLYFSGHGFETIHDTAVYAARAGGADYSHIPATTWATKIWESGLFHEVVLVLDCCRTNLPQPLDIQMPSYDLGTGAASVTKLYIAYATGDDREAREFSLPNGEWIGAFTSLLVDALENADPSDGQNVIAEDVRTTLLASLESFKEKYSLNDLENPDLKMERQGEGDPLIWVKRGPTLKAVHFEVAGAADGSRLTLKDRDLKVLESLEVAHGEARTSLKNGTYKIELDGTARFKRFQVTGEANVRL